MIIYLFFLNNTKSHEIEKSKIYNFKKIQEVILLKDLSNFLIILLIKNNLFVRITLGIKNNALNLGIGEKLIEFLESSNIKANHFPNVREIVCE